MTTDAPQSTQVSYDDLTRDPPEIIAALRGAILEGRPWFNALLDGIRRWRAPHEVVDGHHYYYLIGGEAFDWLLLAERLLDAAADLVSTDERESLVFWGRLPVELDAESFKRAIGAIKYRAHLNYLYGVTVEEALQLSVEEDVHKEVRCRAWGTDLRNDETAFQRIYLKRREELLARFREQRDLPQGESITLPELREFTYWLFKYRLQQCDRAKVAADTRRGLVQLGKLQALGARPAPDAAVEMPQDFIDILL